MTETLMPQNAALVATVPLNLLLPAGSLTRAKPSQFTKFLVGSNTIFTRPIHCRAPFSKFAKSVCGGVVRVRDVGYLVGVQLEGRNNLQQTAIKTTDAGREHR
eukprot:scaffold285169_cov56-Attheya_sp.AAC.4